MSNVISIAAIRSEKLKQALSLYASSGETVVIETRTGLIYTHRMTCRERFVEILNTVGDFAVVDYSDIRSIRPATVAQTSVVNARGEFLPVQNQTGAQPVGPILPFEPRKRRTR